VCGCVCVRVFGYVRVCDPCPHCLPIPYLTRQRERERERERGNHPGDNVIMVMIDIDNVNNN